MTEPTEVATMERIDALAKVLADADTKAGYNWDWDEQRDCHHPIGWDEMPEQDEQLGEAWIRGRRSYRVLAKAALAATPPPPDRERVTNLVDPSTITNDQLLAMVRARGWDIEIRVSSPVTKEPTS